MFAQANIGRYGWLFGLLVVCFAVGCEKKPNAEMAALFSENAELRDELELPRCARDQADAKNIDLQNRLDSMSTDPSPLSAAGAFGPMGQGVEVDRGVHGEIIVRVAGDVLFDSGRVTLKPSAKKTLDRIASGLNSEYAGQTIRVEGYTDADPIKKSSWKDNLELSTQRAMAVQRHLQSRGISDDRIYSAGFGATKFRAANSTAAGKAQNRRVEIVVVN